MRGNPGVDISVIDGGIMDLISQVEEGELDLLFAYEDPRLERKDLRHAPIIPGQKLVIVASTTHPLLGRARITAQDLADQQWCIPAHGARMLHHLHTAFRALDMPPARPRHPDQRRDHDGQPAPGRALPGRVPRRRIAAQLAAANLATSRCRSSWQARWNRLSWCGAARWRRAPGTRLPRFHPAARGGDAGGSASAWLANVGLMNPANGS
ncbi:LysR family transcriptional regulator substrate-binding protein [Cupriavidus basilensis]